MEVPSNVIIDTDRKIVGFFIGIDEIENLLPAIQEGSITTTRPTNANLKAFIGSKQALIDEELSGWGAPKTTNLPSRRPKRSTSRYLTAKKAAPSVPTILVPSGSYDQRGN